MCNDIERKLLALPAKYGGLGLINIMDITNSEYSNSNSITQSLQNDIISHKRYYTKNHREILSIKNKTKTERKKNYTDILNNLIILN